MDIEPHISRRQALGIVGAGITYMALPKVGFLTSIEPAVAATSIGTLTPELTEGPYWVNTMLRRSDVRANTRTATTSPGVAQAGVPLQLTINVLNASKKSSPLDGVAVDIWHANAYGLYSDETAEQAGGGTSENSGGENFLRGYQITGQDVGVYRRATAGQVSFKTIWPGWYTGASLDQFTVSCRDRPSLGRVKVSEPNG